MYSLRLSKRLHIELTPCPHGVHQCPCWHQLTVLPVLVSGVVDSKPVMPGRSQVCAEATAEGRPARQGKITPDRVGPAATDPHPQRQQKLSLSASRPAKSHDTLRLCEGHGAADAQHAAPQSNPSAEGAENTEVCSPAPQPRAAGPPAPELGSAKPAAALQISLSDVSPEPLEVHAGAANTAAIEDAALGHDSTAAAAEAAPEQASPATAAAPAFSEGAAAGQAGRKQQRGQHNKPRRWDHPGAKTGLLHFGTDKYKEFSYKADSVAMKHLRELIVGAGRKDLLGLLKGWTACRVKAGGIQYFQVPGEGIIRSSVNALRYLEDLARLNSGEQPLAGVQHPCNPSHAGMLSDRSKRLSEVPPQCV